MKYEQIYKNKDQFLSLTTLYPDEFEQILPIFRKCWESHYRMYTLDGKRRSSPFNNPTKETPTLATIEDKLFFILVYFKQHPLQEFQAVFFGLSQPRVSRWVKTLSLLLEDTFRRMGYIPCRQGESLAQFMKKLPMGNTATLTQDVVEQTMPRPIEEDAQKAMYSGKKKSHTYKNKVDCTDDQYVVFLSPTYLGTVHDKKIADEENCLYPKGNRLRQDSGFQGYCPDGINIVMPYKKPRNGQLSEMQKWFNQYVGQRRVVIEHAIRGIKRFRIIQQACRLWGYMARDRIMNICTAIHNFRVRSPMRKYIQTTAKLVNARA